MGPRERRAQGGTFKNSNSRNSLRKSRRTTPNQMVHTCTYTCMYIHSTYKFTHVYLTKCWSFLFSVKIIPIFLPTRETTVYAYLV